MKGFTFLLGCAVFYVLLHQGLLLIPATDQWQYNMGMLFQGLSLSYIAAFIFFYVHSHSPLKSTKKKFQRIINKELSDLWIVCKSLTQMLERHTKAEIEMIDEKNLYKTVPILLRKLPVNLTGVVEEEPEKPGSYKLPPDSRFEELNPPITIMTEGFIKWSDAIKHVDRKVNGSLNRILKIQNVVEEEILIDLFDLVKSIDAFLTVAKLYENVGYAHLDNSYLEDKIINIYEVTNKLRPYNKAYKTHST